MAASSTPLTAPAAYRALRTRDRRFDGVFYVGVSSTGVYCRPVCPARTPKAANCRFFASAEAAEKARFRPCLRCRPELAPGLAPVDDARRLAQLIVQRIDEGSVEGDASVEDVAAKFELSSRQLRRIVQAELGVSPIELLQTRRLLLAKQLLTETRLPVTEIAFASGFSSLRRFNDAFLNRYRLPPSRLRARAGGEPDGSRAGDTSRLRLAYRAPYNWSGLLAFLEARHLAGVEHVDGSHYRRTVRLGRHSGWIAVGNDPARSSLDLEFTHTLVPVLPAMLGRLRHLFDLFARPDLIDAQLRKDATLRPSVTRNPGLRVPGAFDGFELAMRAVLRQQVTVATATRLYGRLADDLGEAVATPFPALSRSAPTPAQIVDAGVERLGGLGIIRARAHALVALAHAVGDGSIRLEPGAARESTIDALTALPGIGDWTAQYIAMRALRWPDAFPAHDAALLDRLGGITAADAEARSQRWRPWRSYAVLHLWARPRSTVSSRARRSAAPEPRRDRGPPSPAG